MSVENPNVDVSKLFLITNEEDECWEIIERDGIAHGEDAIIAKFYVAPELAAYLIKTLRKNGIKTSESLRDEAPQTD